MIEKNKFNSIPVLVKWDNINEKNYCKPLIEFKEDINQLFTEIKKCIYGVIHNDSIISNDNKKGIEQLKVVFNYYYDNPKDFLLLNEHLNSELNSITDFISKMSQNTLSEKIEYAKQHIPKELHYMKLLNSFRREISFYIARFTEDELNNLYQKICKNK